MFPITIKINKNVIEKKNTNFLYTVKHILLSRVDWKRVVLIVYHFMFNKEKKCV